MRRLAESFDFGTQSLRQIIMDIDTGQQWEVSVDYKKHDDMDNWGLDENTLMQPETGFQASQPMGMYIQATEIAHREMAEKLHKDGLSFKDVVIVRPGAQQHTHGYLGATAEEGFARLRRAGIGGEDLSALVLPHFVTDRCPTWQTSDTQEQTGFVRDMLGGKEVAIRISGSNLPERFSGASMRMIGQYRPELYNQTAKVLLLNSIMGAIFTGRYDFPTDRANACGMSLMDYETGQWSEPLIAAHANGLKGGKEAFRAKLTPLVDPSTIVGTIATYFVEKYGYDKDCLVDAGGGDNTENKCIFPGDSFSWGSSLVRGSNADITMRDWLGQANSMRDGGNGTFIFGCRSNAAQRLDELAEKYGVPKGNYTIAEDALAHSLPGTHRFFLWHTKPESFPVGPVLEQRIGYTPAQLANPTFEIDLPALIDAQAGSVYNNSKPWSTETNEPLSVCGGAIAKSPEVQRRVAGIFKRSITVVPEGAALGGAVAAAYSYLRTHGQPDIPMSEVSQRLVPRGSLVHPNPSDVQVYHQPGGYLIQLKLHEEKFLAQR